MTEWEKEFLANNEPDIQPTIAANKVAMDAIKAQYPEASIYYTDVDSIAEDMSGDWETHLVRDVLDRHGHLAFGFHASIGNRKVFKIYISYNKLANGKDTYWFDVLSGKKHIHTMEDCDLSYIIGYLNAMKGDKWK